MTDDDEQPEITPATRAQASESSSDSLAAEREREPQPSPPREPQSKRWAQLRTAAQLLLPPLLAAAAMGLHWWINVPDEIHESPNDQGAKDAKGGKAAKKKARKPKPKRDETRTDEQLDADWERLHTTPFDDEPIRASWARRHQVIINRAVVEARRQAFEGAPEQPNVVLSSTTCRTVRCRFVLRSPAAQELEMIGAALERLQISGEPAWRSFEVESLPPEEPEPPAQTHRLVQITVAFRTDANEANEVEVPPAKGGNAPDDEDAP